MQDKLTFVVVVLGTGSGHIILSGSLPDRLSCDFRSKSIKVNLQITQRASPQTRIVENPLPSPIHRPVDLTLSRPRRSSRLGSHIPQQLQQDVCRDALRQKGGIFLATVYYQPNSQQATPARAATPC